MATTHQPLGFHSETAALLDSCRGFVRRYVVLTADQLNVVAAWILHTWAMDVAECTPYLHITAPEKGCGKSRLLETLAILVFRPIRTGGMTAAALMRTVHKEQPTLLLDELDSVFQGDKEVAQALRGILNEGFWRGGNIRKCVGQSHDVQVFNVFGAKALAGIGKVWDTVASRSIIIEMRRKTKAEKVESFRFREVRESAVTLVASLESWSKSQVVDVLKSARPSFPDGFADRQQDISEPLLAIADLAAGEWPTRVRQSLCVLFGAAESEDTSLGVTLLRDIRSVFGIRSGKDSDRIYSAELAAALREIEGSPWSEWEKGKGFTANTLARLLKIRHIHPQTIRTTGGTAKGYKREDFADEWERYLSPLPDEIVTPVTTPVDLSDYSSFKSDTPFNAIERPSHEKPRQSAVVTAVTPTTAQTERITSKRFITGVL